jgi:hypothetical protein
MTNKEAARLVRETVCAWIRQALKEGWPEGDLDLGVKDSRRLRRAMRGIERVVDPRTPRRTPARRDRGGPSFFNAPTLPAATSPPENAVVPEIEADDTLPVRPADRLSGVSTLRDEEDPDG